jgi:acyl phosphate:glycerol-3-phosphate acyltransferase
VTGVLLVLGSYLLGSVPFSLIAGRRAAGVDVRLQGTRNPGASNVWRLAGRRAGAVAGLADFLKGVLPILAARGLHLEAGWQMAAGVAAVLGHDFSAFLALRGGKGGATMLGFFVCFSFPELVVVGILWAGGMLALKEKKFLWSLGSLSVLPLLSSFELFRRPWTQVGIEALLILLLWARVVPGLRRGESHAGRQDQA